jgi:2-succinyl-6-hydroxy-2,4-cyclohexadiene-1-carboxylate synthase
VPETLVLLHGFSGTSRAWDRVAGHIEPERYLPLALDLPGHGRLAASRPITFASATAGVLERAPRRFALAGYSLGGRVALHVALAAPERVSALALISTSAGIAQAEERAERRAADEELARRLESEPFPEWVARWRAQPVFAGEPPAAGELASEDQLRNDPHALAAAMRGLGAGEMEPLWDRLAELTMPVRVIAGARDAKFIAFARRMAGAIPGATLHVIPGGHGLPLESPAELALAIEGAHGR